MQSNVPSSGQRVERVLAGFSGGIQRPRVSLAYRAGMLLVLLAMLVLPLIYLTMIAGAGMALFWHLVHDLSWINQSSGKLMYLGLLCYLLVAGMGCALLVFLVKPLFASRDKPSHLTLDARSQPALFALIEKLCELTGAPRPREVRVNANVNASAGFRRGLWSSFGDDLVLTIGVPLAAGLTARQLTGVLAHELGHFAQGAGMRANYAVRCIQGWFEHAVYVRDGFDEWLTSYTEDEDWQVALAGRVMQAIVELNRLVLRGLMMVGAALSGYMSRQMEHDADAYEAEVVSSGEFARTAMRLRVLGAAHEKALADAQRLHRQRELPDNLPLMMRQMEAQMSAAQMKKLQDLSRDEPAPWHGTHPNDHERILAVNKRQAMGVFHWEAPASELFENFDELCRMTSVHWYEAELGLDLNGVQLLELEGARESFQADEQRTKALQRFFGAKVEGLRIQPLPAVEAQDWQQAFRASEEARSTYEERMKRCGYVMEKAVRQIAGMSLLESGYALDHLANFELNMISPAHARQGLEQTLAEHAKLRDQTRAFELMLATRLAAALAWRYSHEAGVPDAWRQRVCMLVCAQRVLAHASGRLHEVMPHAQAATLLTTIIEQQEDAALSRQVREIEAMISPLLTAVTPELESTPDPLNEARQSLAVTLMQTVDATGPTHTIFSNLENAVQVQLWRISGELAIMAAEVEMAWEAAAKSPQPAPMTSAMPTSVLMPHTGYAMAA